MLEQRESVPFHQNEQSALALILLSAILLVKCTVIVSGIDKVAVGFLQTLYPSAHLLKIGFKRQYILSKTRVCNKFIGEYKKFSLC